MTALSTGQSYTCDANGNTLASRYNERSGCSAGVIARVERGLTYTQTFEAENRLISITVNGQTTQFIYDGDGNLVKKIKPDSSKTLYVGGIYEVDKNSGGTVTGTKTYYAAGGARGSLGHAQLFLHRSTMGLDVGHACFFIQELGATPLSQLFPQIEIQDRQ